MHQCDRSRVNISRRAVLVYAGSKTAKEIVFDKNVTHEVSQTTIG